MKMIKLKSQTSQTEMNNQFNNEASKTWVLVPAFNEEMVIGEILKKLCEKDYSVVVVDDCSTDNTLSIAMKYPIVVLRHIINLGQGASLQTGFDYILNYQKPTCIVTFDSDGQHDVEEISKVASPIWAGDFDVALGSRFLGKKKWHKGLSGMPLLKLLTLRIGIAFTRITTHMEISDTHNGFRAFSPNALKRICITQNRMAHGSEILKIIAKTEMRYCEIPVKVIYSEYSKKKGQSVLNSVNILWDLFFGRNE